MRTKTFGGGHPLGQLRNDIDRLFADFVSGFPNVETPSFINRRSFPAVNVWETADDVFAEAELPGLSADDVEISVVGRELTLKGQRQATTEEGVAYHRRERGMGKFARIVRLPVEIDSEGVKASLDNGVLLVTLPKSPAAKPRKISVSVTS